MLFRFFGRRSRGIATLALAALLPVAAAAQSGETCALEAPDPAGLTPSTAAQLWMPNTGAIRALIVFVQAEADTSRYCLNLDTYRAAGQAGLVNYGLRCSPETARYQSPTEDPATEWPAFVPGGAHVLPQWASRVIDPPGTPPASYQRGSLSQFFWEMSRGQLKYEGVVYPELVVVGQPNLGALYQGDAAVDVIDYIDNNRHGINFDDFDRYINGTPNYGPDTDGDGEPDGDGNFDQLIIVGRNGAGVACFASNGQGCGGGGLSDAFEIGPGAPGPQYLGTRRVRDNARNGSGSHGNGFTLGRVVTVTAHEVLHTMLTLTHTCNDNPDIGNTADNDRLSIMCGGRTQSMNAPDRIQLGWLTPVSVSATALSQTPFTLSARPMDGEALWIHGPGGGPGAPAAGDILVEARTFASAWDGVEELNDGDFSDIATIPHEGLLVYQRGSANLPVSEQFSSMDNSGVTGRKTITAGTLEVARLRGLDPPHLSFTAGDVFSPLSRYLFEFYAGPLDDRVAISNIVPSATSVSFRAWDNFLTAPADRTVSTNYTLANHGAGSHTFPQSLGIPYPADRNRGRTDVLTLGGTLRLGGTHGRVHGGAPEITLQPNATLAVAPGGNVTLWGPDNYAFPVRAGAGAQIEVDGLLHANRVLMTATSASQGWAGVRFDPGSGGAWTNSTIVERVAGVTIGEAEVPVHSVSVTDASPTFTDVRIQLPVAGTVSVNGFYIRETAVPQNAVVITNPLIQGMTGSAVVASGANVRVEVVRGTITGSGETAVVGSGSSTNVYLVPASNGTITVGPQIIDNPGGGVLAVSSGAVRFGAPSPGAGLATVSGNAPGRGLMATGGGLVYAGTTSVYQRNRVFGNGGITNTTGNGLASGAGSAVYARCNWWNTEVAPFRTGTTAGGVVNVSAPLAADPYTNPSATCGGAGVGETGGRPGRSLAASGTEAGRDGETVADRLLFAIDAATPVEAVDLLTALVADEPTSAEASAAVNEAGLIASRVGAPASAVTLLTATTLSPHVPLRVAAWQGLVGSRRATGDLAGALAAAGALAGEGGTAAVQAELARVYLHTAAGDSTAALAALGALEALAPGGVEAELARSFLDGGGEAPTGGRGIASSVVEARKADAAALDAAALAVWPNPAGTSAAVTLTLAEAGEVAVVVYDVLGRAVQLPLAGALTAGAHRAAVDVASLAPGAYVVRATVNTAGGTVVRSARLTIVR